MSLPTSDELAQALPPMSTARLPGPDGLQRSYRYHGGERGLSPVVFLHGAASNGSRWWHLAGSTQHRGKHTLLCPDLRGHGLSPWRGPARIEHWCQDIIDLLDHIGASQAHLVGHCLGANLAVHFAARHPQRCQSVVLIEPMVREALRGSLRRLRRFAPLLKAAVALIVVANRVGIKRRQMQQVDLRALDQQVQRVAEPSDGKDAMRQRFASPWHDLRVVPSAQYLQNLLEVLRPLPLSELHCPALALLSSGELMADSAITRQALSALADCKIVAMDAEHWIPTEQPEALLQQVDAWIDQLR